MLYTKLKKIRALKDSYHELQKTFWKEFTERYPYIMEADIAKITNKLETELQTLLCSTMKYSSVKIPLKAIAQGYSDSENETTISIQRGEKGFYYPNSQRGTSDIHYMNLKYYLNDEDNMFIKYTKKDYSTGAEEEKDHLLVQLKDILKPEHSRRVFPEKIDVYFKFLREVMRYREKFLCYLDEGQANDLAREFKVDKLSFVLNARSMDIDYNKKIESDEDRYYSNYTSHVLFQYKKAPSDLYHFLDYSSPGDRDYSYDMQRTLDMFINNYEAIRDNLDKEEALKKKAYTTCEDFLRQIEVHTLPFKVLGELKK